MVGCSRSYCIFPNALVMQFYDTQSVTNIDFTSKTNNSWYKSPITAWKIPFERYDSYLSPNKKKQTHYPFFHIYFNGFLPPFNFLLHPWTVAYTDNILCVWWSNLQALPNLQPILVPKNLQGCGCLLLQFTMLQFTSVQFSFGWNKSQCSLILQNPNFS